MKVQIYLFSDKEKNRKKACSILVVSQWKNVLLQSKNLLMTLRKTILPALLTVVLLLVASCVKEHSTEPDEQRILQMQGVWLLDEVSLNDETFAPADYLEEGYESDEILLTFRPDGTGEACGEYFEWMIYVDSQMTVTRTYVMDGDTLDNMTLFYDILLLTDREARLEGFFVPVPHLTLPAGNVQCHLTKVGALPEEEETKK